MGNQEIKINQFELQNCNGNLNNLFTNWDNVPIVSSEIIYESKGKSAESIKSCLDMTKQVSVSMKILLQSSISFFQNAETAFQESDNSASQNINAVIR